MLAAACGATPAPRITRRLGGERRVGAFVSPYSYEWYLRGEVAIAQGELEVAAQALARARAGPEEDPYVLARLADVLDQLDEQDRAQDVLADGIELDPRSEAILLVRGTIAERHDRFGEAIDAYQRAARAAPLSEKPALALAALLRRRGARGRADAVLDRYILRAGLSTPGALRARLDLALSRGDGAGAAATVEALLQHSPARAVDVHRAAESALAGGHPTLAAGLLDAMPRTDDTALLRVRALLDAGRAEEVEGILMTTAPEAFGGELSLARLYLRAGRADRAEEIALGVSVTDRDNPEAWLVLGISRLALGSFGAAAADLAQVPRGAGGFAEARVAMAQVFVAQGLSAVAGELLGNALDGPSDDGALLRCALATIRSDRGDAEGALAVLADSSDSRVIEARGHVLEAANRIEEAASLWASLPPTAADHSKAVQARIRAEKLAARGAYRSAILVLQQWAEEAPEDLMARARLAELLARAGRAEEARVAAGAVVALQPTAATEARLAPVLAGAAGNPRPLSAPEESALEDAAAPTAAPRR